MAGDKAAVQKVLAGTAARGVERVGVTAMDDPAADTAVSPEIRTEELAVFEGKGMEETISNDIRVMVVQEAEAQTAQTAGWRLCASTTIQPGCPSGSSSASTTRCARPPAANVPWPGGGGARGRPRGGASQRLLESGGLPPGLLEEVASDHQE